MLAHLIVQILYRFPPDTDGQSHYATHYGVIKCCNCRVMSRIPMSPSSDQRCWYSRDWAGDGECQESPKHDPRSPRSFLAIMITVGVKTRRPQCNAAPRGTKSGANKSSWQSGLYEQRRPLSQQPATHLSNTLLYPPNLLHEISKVSEGSSRQLVCGHCNKQVSGAILYTNSTTVEYKEYVLTLISR